MSRGREALPPQDSGRSNQSDFGPHQFDNGARRIEQGISMLGQSYRDLQRAVMIKGPAARRAGE